MSQVISVIHTTPATIAIFGELIGRSLPGSRIINLLDDSIVPQLGANGGDYGAITPRWTALARMAQEQNADAVLNACSSIGEICDGVSADLGIPVVRVDRRMARRAVEGATKIAVVATQPLTMEPTTRLLERTAAQSGLHIDVHRELAEGALTARAAGDGAAHDALVRAAILRSGELADRIVLAQASMAPVLPSLPDDLSGRVFASPVWAVAELLDILAAGR